MNVTHGDLMGVGLNYQMSSGSGRLFAGLHFGSWMMPVATAAVGALAAATFN